MVSTTLQQAVELTIPLSHPQPALPTSQFAGLMETASREITKLVTNGSCMTTIPQWIQTAQPTTPVEAESAQLISQSATQMVTALLQNALVDAHGILMITIFHTTVAQTMFNKKEDSRFTTAENGVPSVMTTSTLLMPMLHAEVLDSLVLPPGTPTTTVVKEESGSTTLTAMDPRAHSTHAVETHGVTTTAPTPKMSTWSATEHTSVSIHT